MDLAPGVPEDLSKRYRIANEAVDGNSNVFSEPIRQQGDGSLYVEVCLASSGTNSTLLVTRGTKTGLLNSGNVLVAGQVYAFELTYQDGEEVNFQFGLSTTLNWFRILYRHWV